MWYIAAVMPVNWILSQPERLVSVRAEGPCALAEVEAMFDALVVAEVMTWRKLFDARTLEPIGTADDLMALGARMRAYATMVRNGPLAFVVDDPGMQQLVRRYINLAANTRPVRLFPNVQLARAWLDTFPP